MSLQVFWSAIFYLVCLNCFISSNLLIKFMFFLQQTFLSENCGCDFTLLLPLIQSLLKSSLIIAVPILKSMFLLIDTVRMDELRANSLVLVHLKNLMLMEFWRHCLSHLQCLVLMKEPWRKKWWGLHATKHL